MVFDEIYNEYREKVYRLCMGYVNDHELARDLTQDTFIIVWEQLPKFRNESAISTWIFRIASNSCLRQIEKQNRIRKSDLHAEIIDVKADNKEREVQLLYQYISELPEIDRIIISLELEKVRQAEIANIVGLSEGNIRIRIYRIKEKLMQKFKKYEQQQ